MTLGITFALLAGLLWSFSQVVDKTTTMRIVNPWFLFTIHALAALIVSAIILPFVAPVSGGHIIVLLVSASMHLIANISYFKALHIEEPSRVIPLFGFMTIFTVLLGAIFLGEIFSTITYLGISIVVVGSWIIMARRHIFSPFRSRALGLMIFGSLFLAGSNIIIKYLFQFYSAGSVIGYQFFLLGLLGLSTLIILWRQIRIACFEARKHFAIQSINELFKYGAFSSYLFATSVWFVSLVAAISSVQYALIFLWSLILHKIRPDLMGEVVNRRIVTQKILAIALIIGGIFLISM